MRLPIISGAAGLLLLSCAAGADQGNGAAVLLPALEVVGSTPLPGPAGSAARLAAPVQVIDGEALAARPGESLPDLLNGQLGSVFINDIQGNAWQPDINYRGFTASPLLGTPQGLSVYVDGVRLNQPFGDVVSWDILPRSAIAGMSLMPGSNPLFGLNTLGGALAIQTKDGLSHPGTAVQMVAGRQRRSSLEFEHGGSAADGLHWFVTGNAHQDAGWREDSPSRLGQIFGKLGWTDARTDLALSVAMADNKLTGNGLQESRLLGMNYASVYTKPDETGNRSLLLNLTGKHALAEQLLLSGNLYYRRIRTSTLNGDVNEGSLDQSVYQPTATEQGALLGGGYSGYPASGANASNTPFPYWRCIANVLLQDEPAEKCNGLINRSETVQDNHGLGLQLSGQSAALGPWTLGAAYDASHMRFRQTSQFGYLNPDRSITPVNFFADGTELDDNGQPIDARVDLRGVSRTWSLFASQTLSLGAHTHFTLSGRYNQTRIQNRDQLTPGGGSGSLDGDHRYGRFNPAAGLVYAPTTSFSLYGGYSEGSRTPTAIELGCADPANPCRLPNAMAGDPPLRQVVTRTWEAGLRGGGPAWHWRAGVFRAVNDDDILFVVGTQVGYGYFRNVGQTRRQGVELGSGGRIGAWDLSADYTYLDATFQSPETLNGAANSSQDANGNISVRPGDRLPLIPQHILKLRAAWQATGALSVSAGMQAVSGSLARGNENGQHSADGVYYLSSGRNPGYAVFDLAANYKPLPRLSLFGQVSNLFDRRYSTAAQLGTSAFTANGAFVASPFSGSGDNTSLVHSTFFAPGAPRSFWVGLRYEFDTR